MEENKTFVVKIERSVSYTFFVDAKDEDEAESIVDEYAKEGRLDNVTASEGFEWGRAYTMYKVNAHIKKIKEEK